MRTRVIFFIIFILNFFVAHAEQLPALIRVSSFAEKTIDPNIMNIQIEIWAKSNSSSSAQESVTKLEKKAKELAEKFKIKKEDIQTHYYSVSPEYSYESKTGVSKIQGYSVVHSITLSLKSLDQAGSFIEQIPQGDRKDKSGIAIQNISWDSDKKGVAESDCISQAVKSARVRADDLAKAAQVKIKGVYSISNQQVYSNFESAQQMARPMKSFKMDTESALAGDVPALSPGKIKVRADVSIEYYIQN
ncbi:MAG: SIMPL domain-containing protein [Pseudobdellovibrio sp.]